MNKLTIWALAVLRRDDDTCQHCGANTCLDAAHIIPRSRSADLRLDLDNGVTLCRTCHEYFETHPIMFGFFVERWRAAREAMLARFR